ncbi:hypothetical protein CEXT_131271 [Caerostris extrusa]|uniref:Uncharacterized protein n=1 Tax=Caerostris extrusa TaxID=172846 RepID=A0AAV4UTX1_CAEEX|nr:hypothetical protein CEXT_131271 [Caerostris extrusa]
MPQQNKIGHQNSQDGFSRSRNGARNFRLAGADIGNCICYDSTPTLARGRSLNFHHGIKQLVGKLADESVNSKFVEFIDVSSEVGNVRVLCLGL